VELPGFSAIAPYICPGEKEEIPLQRALEKTAQTLFRDLLGPALLKGIIGEPPFRDSAAAIPRFLDGKKFRATARFHETTLPIDWRPDLSLEEGATMVVEGEFRNNAISLKPHLLMSGVETLLGIDVRGVRAISEDGEEGLEADIHLLPDIDVRRYLPRIPLLGAFFRPVPIAEVVRETPSLNPLALAALRGLGQIEVEMGFGSITLVIDGERLAERAIKGELTGDLRLDWILPGSRLEVDFDRQGFRFPVDLPLSTLSVHPRGKVIVSRKSADQSEVIGTDLACEVTTSLVPDVGPVTVAGIAGGSALFSHGASPHTGERPFLQEIRGEIRALTLRSASGGKVVWHLDDSEGGVEIENGLMVFGYLERPGEVPFVLENLDLEGSAYWQGPTTRTEYSPFSLQTFSPLYLKYLRGVLKGGMRLAIRGRREFEARSVEVRFNGDVAARPDRPIVRAIVQAILHQVFGEDLGIDLGLSFWTEDDGGGCRLRGEGKIGLAGQSNGSIRAGGEVQSAVALDSGNLSWKLRSNESAQWGPYALQGQWEGEGQFKGRRFKDWYKNLRISGEGLSFSHKGHPLATGITVNGAGYSEKGEAQLQIRKGGPVRDIRLEFQTPWRTPEGSGRFEGRLPPIALTRDRGLSATTLSGQFEIPWLTELMRGGEIRLETEARSSLTGRQKGSVRFSLKGLGRLRRGQFLFEPDPSSGVVIGPFEIKEDRTQGVIQCRFEGPLRVDLVRREVFPEKGASGFRNCQMVVTTPEGRRLVAFKGVDLLLNGPVAVRRRLLKGRSAGAITVSGLFDPETIEVSSRVLGTEIDTGAMVPFRIAIKEMPTDVRGVVELLARSLSPEVR